ncbi:MAG: DNA replication/repair protein RecF [Bacteroidetes bacterium]|nr:DNA replication/repair protein RecF [Bacteroidota bacterium]
MRVKKVQLTNFRNHSESSLEFTGGINIITGANAQGKTSILEALSYVCLTKSFLQQSDSTVPKFGTEAFTIDATIETDRNIVNHVRVAFETGAGKKYFWNKNEIKKSADVIGMFPIVVLSPGDFALTGGAPSERRKFVDIVLSQISRSYLEELIEYRRALKQRNKVLLDGKINNTLDGDLLAAWTDALVAHGTRVIIKRGEFVREFQDTFANAYTSLVEYGEVPKLVYEPSFAADGDIFEVFHKALRNLSKVERARGSTLAGPHRDDIGFILNDMPIREFASQGQHKTFLVALKIAEFHYIKAMLSETPAMLLDDVMTELDYTRAAKTIRAISGLGQTFITATDMLNFDEKLLDMRDTKFHFVREGSVVYENA